MIAGIDNSTFSLQSKDDPNGLFEKSYELKYSFNSGYTKKMLSWLHLRCHKDPQHPKNIVSSIYFDTPHWHALAEKVNSDYHKNKHRLRWYSDLDTYDVLPDAYLESKARMGTQRTKLRYLVDLPAPTIAKMSLQSGLLKEMLHLLLNDLKLPPQLMPVYIVRYHRYRFIEPVTQSRICLDTHIHVPKVNINAIATGNRQPLPISVIEVKGQQANLPPVLHQLTAMGCSRSAFSKYLHCYEQLTQQQISG